MDGQPQPMKQFWKQWNVSCTLIQSNLEEHCHLLFSDFAALASGPTKDKLEWISEIDSALGVALHVACGS
jgi:hypothetical protein